MGSIALKAKRGIAEFREMTRRAKDALDQHEELMKSTNGTFKAKPKEGEPCHDSAQTRNKSKDDQLEHK